MSEKNRSRIAAGEWWDAEHAAASMMVGPCPSCGSDQTLDGDGVPGVDDITQGLCIGCHHRWCLECGQPLASGQAACRHWDDEAAPLDALESDLEGGARHGY